MGRSAWPPARWVTSTGRVTPRRPLAELAAPNFLLKIIPHVDGSPRICELVEYHLEDIQLKGVWSGPGALSLHAHALAPVAELPVLEVVSTAHLVADLTLGLGKVVHDYLAPDSRILILCRAPFKEGRLKGRSVPSRTTTSKHGNVTRLANAPRCGRSAQVTD